MAVRKLLENENLSDALYVYSSPEAKAVETARVIADIFDLEVRIRESLSEISMNTGFLHQSEFDKRVGDYLAGYDDTGFEDYDSAQDRIVTCISSIVKDQGKNPAVTVTHGRIMTAFFSYLTGERLGYQEWRSIETPDLSVLDLERSMIVKGFLSGYQIVNSLSGSP